MNRMAKLAFVLFAVCPVLLAQKNVSTAVEDRVFVSEVIVINHRDPLEILRIVVDLSSRAVGSSLTPGKLDDDVKTITVKDYLENLASIKAAINKLDVPIPKANPVNFQIDVLWASKKELAGDPVPSHLSDVVSEVSKTLNYKYFRQAALITNIITNNSASGKVLLGLPGKSDAFYFKPLKWDLTPNRGNLDSDYIVSGKFRMTYGTITANAEGVSMDNVNIELKDGEKILLGTTTIGGLAMIIVVSAKSL
jgi:hypothetical protein